VFIPNPNFTKSKSGYLGKDTTIHEKNYGDLCLENTHRTHIVLENYLKSRKLPPYPLGMYLFKDCTVFRGWGFALSLDEVICSLPGFGWDSTHLKIADEKNRLNNIASLQENKGHNLHSAALITFPGAFTYGHWLVDIPFRLFFLDELKVADVDYYLFGGPPKNWMLALLGLFAVDVRKVIWLDESSFCKVERLAIPTTLSYSNNGALPPHLLSSVFSKIKLNNKIVTARNNIVFVVHRSITSSDRRVWINQDYVAEFLMNIGVTVHDPAISTLEETIDIFSKAKLVIGQDGSGLHNCLFSDADCVVIETEPRSNIIHTSIQDANNNKICYIGCDVTKSGTFYLPNDKLSFLCKIIEDARHGS
jgi:capsular polysaccharide biosynthesis protein